MLSCGAIAETWLSNGVCVWTVYFEPLTLNGVEKKLEWAHVCFAKKFFDNRGFGPQNLFWGENGEMIFLKKVSNFLSPPIQFSSYDFSIFFLFSAFFAAPECVREINLSQQFWSSFLVFMLSPNKHFLFSILFQAGGKTHQKDTFFAVNRNNQLFCNFFCPYRLHMTTVPQQKQQWAIGKCWQNFMWNMWFGC